MNVCLDASSAVRLDKVPDEAGVTAGNAGGIVSVAGGFHRIPRDQLGNSRIGSGIMPPVIRRVGISIGY